MYGNIGLKTIYWDQYEEQTVLQTDHVDYSVSEYQLKEGIESQLNTVNTHRSGRVSLSRQLVTEWWSPILVS